MLLMFIAAMVALRAPGQASDSRAPGEGDPAATIRAYHEALAAEDPARVVRLLGPTFFMADETPDEGEKRFGAHLFLVGKRLESWPTNYLTEVGPHLNVFETLSVSIRGDAAVVTTKDTGSNRFRTWKDEETTWLLGRIDGAWRIVGMIIRDIQLPPSAPTN